MNEAQLKGIAIQNQTPLYLYDGDGIETTYAGMKEALPSEFQLFYSVKANPSLGICQLLNTLGSGIEVASGGELNLALRAGYAPEKILLSGPGKTAELLEYAIEKKIAAIIVESCAELELLDKLAATKNQRVQCGVRINPNYDLPKAKIKMAGTGKQFGIDEDHLEAFVGLLKNSRNVTLTCLHVYVGTQIFDSTMVSANVSNIFDIARRLIKDYKQDLKIIDFGGGFGVPYFGEGENFNFETFGKELREILQRNRDIADGRRLVFETGRYLLAENGYYIARILYKKKSKGKTFLIADGGMNHHALSTFRGRRVRNNFPITLLKAPENNDISSAAILSPADFPGQQNGQQTGQQTETQPPENNDDSSGSPGEEVSIAGPLCTPEDVVIKNQHLPLILPGDMMCILKSGAYGLSYSPAQFLGHPLPQELM
ncbi:MAG: diaminopimelate decarboxylase, partial [bacterium]|nr:diaminopimelate decarboxylase [bacterium]